MDKVKIKGIKNGFRIVIAEYEKFDEVFEDILEKVNNTMELFKLKKELTIEIEGGELTHAEKCNVTKTLLEMLDYNAVITYTSAKELEKRQAEIKETIYHEGTLRSGQNVSSEGHLIIMGDVNPGAEISAVGNIVVLGALKGVAHAGSDGDEKATVCALMLQPTQLRIAEIITRAPETDRKPEYMPEVAKINDGSIYTYPLYKTK